MGSKYGIAGASGIVRGGLRLLAVTLAGLATMSACSTSSGKGDDAGGAPDAAGDVLFNADGLETGEPADGAIPDGPVDDAADGRGPLPDAAADARGDTGQDVPVQPDEQTPPDEDVPVVEEVVVPPLPDGDGDGVPDEADPFPDNPMYPGVAMDNAVYMHTATELWTMQVKTYELVLVSEFKWPPEVWSDQMTDIAFDAYGVLYGVSFDYVYTCHPMTAQCTRLGELPEMFNALTLVPKGLVDPKKEVIVAISNAGGWYRMDINGGQVTVSQLGEYGYDYSSSGDAYSIDGVGTFAAVDKGYGDDIIVEVDPSDGHVLQEICPLPGFSNVYGLAGWTDRAFAFDESGAILIIDTGDRAIVKQIKDQGQAWWGAGVCTVLKEK
jgi:hypothetical protein